MIKIHIIIFIILLICPILNAQGKMDLDSSSKPSVLNSSNIFSFVSPPLKGEDDKRWYFTLGGLYYKKTGSTDTVNANNETLLTFDDNISNFEISYRTFFAQVNDETVENKGFGIIRFDYYIFPRIELFIFSQFEYNRMIELKYRYNDGAGIKFVMIRNNYWKMDLSGAPVYQVEKYDVRERKTGERWSFRFRVTITPIKEVLINYIYLYIPRMFDMYTFRFSHDASLKINIAKNLSLKVGYLYQYNNDILPGIKKRDENIYSQISIEL